MFRLIVLLIIVCVVSHVRLSQPTEPYPHSVNLGSSNRYTLYWKYNATHITFETHVQAHGFTGFGISTNSSCTMFPGDVVVGYITKNNQVHFNDYHTTMHAPPIMDKHQDWTILEWKEDHTGTMLKFVRALHTSDAHDDVPITARGNHVIWSFTLSDPTGVNNLTYHNMNRGCTTMNLLADDTIVGK